MAGLPQIFVFLLLFTALPNTIQLKSKPLFNITAVTPSIQTRNLTQ